MIMSLLKVGFGVLFVGVVVAGVTVNKLTKPTEAPAQQETIQTTATVIAASPAVVEKIDLNKKKVVLLNIPASRTLYLNSEVTAEAVQLIVQELQKLNEESRSPIYLLLDSPGGSVFDGNLLITYIETSKAPIYTVVFGLCASMCAHIHQHGKTRYMVDRSILMFHPASGGVRGQLPDMLSLLTFVKLETDKLDAYDADRARINREKFQTMVRNQLWLAADEAKKLNLVDEIVSVSMMNGASVANTFNLKHRLNKLNVTVEPTPVVPTIKLLESFK